jgi:hypothetical protein
MNPVNGVKNPYARLITSCAVALDIETRGMPLIALASAVDTRSTIGWPL